MRGSLMNGTTNGTSAKRCTLQGGLQSARVVFRRRLAHLLVCQRIKLIAVISSQFEDSLAHQSLNVLRIRVVSSFEKKAIFSKVRGSVCRVTAS
jgi:hypothetical protein